MINLLNMKGEFEIYPIFLILSLFGEGFFWRKKRSWNIWLLRLTEDFLSFGGGNKLLYWYRHNNIGHETSTFECTVWTLVLLLPKPTLKHGKNLETGQLWDQTKKGCWFDSVSSHIRVDQITKEIRENICWFFFFFKVLTIQEMKTQLEAKGPETQSLNTKDGKLQRMWCHFWTL